MFRRSTWGKVSPDKLDDLIVALRPQVEMLAKQVGFQGFALSANRESGAVLATTMWETAAQLQASEEIASSGRGSVSSAVPGLELTEVDRFETVLQERVLPPRVPSFVRLLDIQGAPDKLDETAAFVKNDVLSVLKAQPGFRGTTISVNRTAGRLISVTIWSSAAEREASDAVMAPIRERGRTIAGAPSFKTERYEVVLADIRIPAPA